MPRSEPKRLRQLGVALLLSLHSACSAPPAHAPSVESKGEDIPFDAETEAREWLGPLASVAGDAGAETLEVLSFGADRTGGRFEGFVRVSGEACVLLFARGSRSIDDVDLVAYSEDGTEYAAVERAADFPTTLVCPKEPVRLFVSASIIRGHGFVALGAQRVPAKSANAVTAATHAQPPLGDSREIADSWPHLLDTIAAHRARLGGDWHETRRAPLPVDFRVESRISAEIPARRCLSALAVPAGEVRGLQLALTDRWGRDVARSSETIEAPHLTICSGEHAEPVDLKVRPLRGRGRGVIVLFQSAASSGRARLDSASAPVFLNDDRSRGTAVPAPKGEPIELQPGHIRTKTIASPACSMITIRTADSFGGFRAALRLPSGEVESTVHAGSQARLVSCRNEPVDLELEALRSSGQVFVEVSSQKLPNEALRTAPHAAARLLESHWSHSAGRPLAKVQRIKAATLKPREPQRHSVSTGSGECLTILVEASPPGAAIGARLLSRTNQRILDESEGDQGLRLRTCSADPSSGDTQVEFWSAQRAAKVAWLVVETH